VPVTGSFPRRKEAAVPGGAPDRKQMGHYFALAQVSLEMVVPLVIGIFLDHAFHWEWAAITGAVLGFAVGLLHLVVLVKQQGRSDSSKPRRDAP
jgi:F0F1-type ATP synthase assembly protein I